MKSSKKSTDDRPRTLDNIVYKYYPIKRKKKIENPISVIGIDTEAYANGRCFMIALSDGSVFTPKEWPNCMFSRKYRNGNFVAYNLKYDEGALLQRLPKENLQELRTGGQTKYQDLKWSIIPGKMLKVVKGKNGITIYDMYGFFGGSLNFNAEKYLGESKIDIETKTFTKDYVTKNWDKIAKYCVKDADLVCRLAAVLIKKFLTFGVAPKRLFSTAYVSYQYFSKHTNYVDVNDIYKHQPKLLQLALQSYNGGKFEVTEKGSGYYYEYDIVSAYPAEIRDLIDIRNCKTYYTKRPINDASYAFLDCTINIPSDCPNPSPMYRGNVWVYPVGIIRRVITLTEYQYFLRHGADITIHNAAWLVANRKVHPYRKEINKLIKYKHQFKLDNDQLGYHIIKIFLNSLYGKMAQAIKKGDKWHTSTCWNPLYASIITANCRTKISEMQATYPSVIAVHTDSLISKAPLDLPKEGGLGDMIYELEGDGVVIGCGVYQIGKKYKFRGQKLKSDLTKLIKTRSTVLHLEEVRPYSWKEVVFHNWELSKINYFDRIKKDVRINFDTKRVWINDYKTFDEIQKRNVESLPHISIL